MLKIKAGVLDKYLKVLVDRIHKTIFSLLLQAKVAFL
jgi:hypothetical protein